MPAGQEDLRIRAVPEQVTAVVRMVRVKNRTIIVGADGGLYSLAKRNYVSIWQWWDSGEVLACLSRLKLLPKGSMAEAKRLQEADKARRAHGCKVADLRAACRALGVPVTRAMERVMKKKA